MSHPTQQDLDQLLEHLEQHFKEPLLNAELRLPNQILLEIDSGQFTESVIKIHADAWLNVRYLTLFAVDEKSHFSLHLLFLLKSHQVVLSVCTRLERTNPTYPALSPRIPSAEWHEREIHDLFGIIPEGGNLRPLVLHRDWPCGGQYPMRYDFNPALTPVIQEVPHQFDMPEGAGRHQVAVGPIHAGIIEPGHLRFSVTGEQIHRFDAQLFYTHKGIEKMGEGRPYLDVLVLAEHVCGMCAFAHSLAFTQAIENLSEIEIPKRAIFLRAILLEMERLASHFSDLTAICLAGGFGFASARAAYFRELILQMNLQLSGHRFLRGINTVGGLLKEPSNENLTQVLKNLAALSRQFREWRDLVLSTDSFLDRIEGSGTISQETTRQLGLVGPAARSSGLDDDMRRDFPYQVHTQLPVYVKVSEQGDVYSRFVVRIEEVEESISQISRLISTIPSGILFKSISEKSFIPGKAEIGIVESAKGSLIHWVMLGENQQIYRWHVRSASYMNWRGMVQATMGNNIVPDSPLINKSFNLCYACSDR